MNYDAAKFIEDDLRNKNNVTGMVINRNKLDLRISQLKKIYEANR